ncbi:MAG: ABC transporter permease [Actinobacteria bacterium]|nr:ABC transporter permease [Actinomycetota bacterium]
MKAYLHLTLSYFRGFVRDRAALFWTLAFPLLFVTIFGLIFGRELGGEFELGLVVQDRSPQAGVVAQVLRAFPAFKLTEDGLERELADLREGRRRAVLVVPDGFGASLATAAPRPVTVHYDASQQSNAQVVLPVIYRAVDLADRTLTRSAPLVRVELQTLQTERLRSIDFIIPGIVAMSVMQLGIFGAVNMVSLRERRVLRRLAATPVPRVTVVAADVTLRLGLTLVQTAILVSVARAAFGVNVTGNLLVLAGVVLLGVLAFLALGFLIAAFARTEQGFFPIAQVPMFIMMFMSGIFFPIEFVPEWVRPIINAFPLTFLGDAVRQVMVGGAPLFPLALDLGVLAAFLAVFFVGAVRLFRWE